MTATMTVKMDRVDRDLVRRAKVTAAGRGVTFKTFVLEAIEAALPKDIEESLAAIERTADERPTRKGRR